MPPWAITMLPKSGSNSHQRCALHFELWPIYLKSVTPTDRGGTLISTLTLPRDSQEAIWGRVRTGARTRRRALSSHLKESAPHAIMHTNRLHSIFVIRKRCGSVFGRSRLPLFRHLSLLGFDFGSSPLFKRFHRLLDLPDQALSKTQLFRKLVSAIAFAVKGIFNLI